MAAGSSPRGPVVRSTIAESSAREGKPTSSLKKKRSSSASGSGYVPSISIGFCVARTKKGRGSGWPTVPTVTTCSCMASSNADCVLGVARLISSASTRLAKIGPGWNWKARPPWAVSSSTLVPRMSAGMRSGVNWMRLYCSCRARAIVRTSSVLPSPGSPSSSTWPPAISAIVTPRTTSSCPTMTRETSRSSASTVRRSCSIAAPSAPRGSMPTCIGAH